MTKLQSDIKLKYLGHDIWIKQIQKNQWIVAINGDVDVIDEDFATPQIAIREALLYVDQISKVNPKQRSTK